MVDEYRDYHWYRQDKDKPGAYAVRNVDASGNLITNPTKANRKYWHIDTRNINTARNSFYINYNSEGQFFLKLR